MKRFLCIMLISALPGLALFAGGKKDAPADNGKLNIVAVNFPSYDFARAIAGDKANLAMLLPPGTESHSFDPAPRDIMTIRNSDVFIYTGGESDEWAGRILESIDAPNMIVVRMMDAVETVEEEIVEGMEEEEEEEEGPAYDEHIWTSPINAQLIVQAIADALSEADASNAPAFRQNAQNYIAQLGEVDKEFRAIVEGARRKTIVFGDRFPFRYFADAYGLSYFAAFPGCSTETEPSAATVAFLIKKINAENIPVVFHIELSNEKMADTIAGETGAAKRLLHACHNIAKRDFDRGLTFLELQRANIPALKEALQ